MKPRTLVALLAVFVLLVAAYAVLVLLDRSEPDATSVDVGFEKLTDKTVAKVEVAGTAGEYTLERTDDGWTVNGESVPAGKAKELFDALKEARVGEVLSRNKDNHGLFEVTDDAGTQVTFSGTEKLSVVLGKEGAGLNQFYMRIPGSDEVRVAEGTVHGLLTRDANGWRDNAIFEASFGSIERLDFRYPDEDFRLEAKDEKWNLSREGSSREAKKDVADQILSKLSFVQAAGFASAEEKASAKNLPEAAAVDIYGADEKELAKLTFKRKDASTYFVARGGSSELWTLGSAEVEQMLKRSKDL